eukprot:TRINITY_DN20186_c0_g1_i1.p1 TRINITY_DN20186_c0_g1~~TRINITY_DN20186_c0_g1_i1.p1  ORF type:complete len:187 (+),score=57.25 TRINITY_DN20186_c0_g1_i1:327-887(+)
MVAVSDWSTVTGMDSVDMAFTCMGTSRQNAEVKKAMEEQGADEGFAAWLNKVDVENNVAFADAAVRAGAKYVGRVSASKADASNNGGGFNVYYRHQGIADERYQRAGWGVPVGLFRPGPLERGSLARPWEIGKKDATPVEHVAAAMVSDAFARRGSAEQPLARIFSVPAIRAMAQGKPSPDHASEL